MSASDAILVLNAGSSSLKFSLYANDADGPKPPTTFLGRVLAARDKPKSPWLLVFALDELKLQVKGGRGLTLVDLDARDALVSAAAFGDALRVLGTGRGGKARDEIVRGAALEGYVGRRARKGRRQEVMPQAMRVLGAEPA